MATNESDTTHDAASPGAPCHACGGAGHFKYEATLASEPCCYCDGTGRQGTQPPLTPVGRALTLAAHALRAFARIQAEGRYDFNADPRGVTRKTGDALSAIEAAGMSAPPPSPEGIDDRTAIARAIVRANTPSMRDEDIVPTEGLWREVDAIIAAGFRRPEGIDDPFHRLRAAEGQAMIDAAIARAEAAEKERTHLHRVMATRNGEIAQLQAKLAANGTILEGPAR